MRATRSFAAVIACALAGRDAAAAMPGSSRPGVHVDGAASQDVRVAPAAGGEAEAQVDGERAARGGPGVQAGEVGLPVVHVDGAARVELVEVVAQRGAGLRAPIVLRTVCVGRCDRAVDGRAGSRFFFELEGRRSREFRLGSRAGHVYVTVHPARPRLRVGGAIVMAIGAALVAGGAYAAAAASDAPSGASARTGGGLIVGAGAAVFGGGLVMFVLGRMRARVHDATHVHAR